MPALTAKLNDGEETLSARAQAEMAVNIIFDGLIIN